MNCRCKSLPDCVGGKHTTLCKVGLEFLNIVGKIPEVTRVIISRISGGHSGHRKLKLQPVNTGLRALATGNGKVQEFFVITKTPDTVRAKVFKAWTA